MPIYTRYFSPTDYGAFNYVSSSIQIFTAIVAVGADHTYARLFFAARSEEDRKTLTTNWILFLAIWGALLFALLVPFSKDLSRISFATDEYWVLWAFGLACSPLVNINVVSAQALRNSFRMRRFFMLSVLGALLPVVLALIAVLVFNTGVTGVIGAVCVSALIMLPIRIWSVREFFVARVSFDMLRDLLKYGAPLAVSLLASALLSMNDRLLLAHLVSLHDLGVYSIAVAVSGVMLLAATGFWYAWTPYTLELYEGRPEARALVGRAATFAVVGLGCAAVAISAFAPDVINILVAEEFREATVFVPPLVLGLPFTAGRMSRRQAPLSPRRDRYSRYCPALRWFSASPRTRC